jgi:1-acyl-sn-glycerol-3-phosphate acyltransferase
MYRIILMVVRLFYKVPYYLIRIWWLGTRKNFDLEKNYAFIKKVTKAANRAGRVTIESYGVENIPKENGFIFFPNHQGMFDALVFLESCPVPFSVVYKKEVSNVILLKQVFRALHAIAIDREDIKQSLQVINQMTEEVKQGRNFLIFPEGTRSRMGNQLLPFKGGTFKSAVRAKCPIVPCALIDSYKPFDEKSIAPVTVKLIYLPPICYEEYKQLKTPEIADIVKNRYLRSKQDYWINSNLMVSKYLPYTLRTIKKNGKILLPNMNYSISSTVGILRIKLISGYTITSILLRSCISWIRIKKSSPRNWISNNLQIS